jgi:hypothetical protein
MKKIKSYLISVMILFLCAAPLPAFAALSDHYIYDTYGGTWSDTNKTSDPNDNNLCWAAAASNTLMYNKWNSPPGQLFNSSTDIFNYYISHWTNAGGNPVVGWNWWLTGQNLTEGQSGWSQVKQPGGNFYSSLNPNNFMRYNGPSAGSQAPSLIDAQLDGGIATTLTLLRSGGAHAVTAWGYKYDDITQAILGLYVTDSDDSYLGLKYYDISLLDGNWYLENYYGTFDTWFIAEVEGIGENPFYAGSGGENPFYGVTGGGNPEPATIVGMLSGLLLLSFRRIFRMGEGRVSKVKKAKRGKK